MKKILFMIGFVFLASGCSTLKVDIDYDMAYDFHAKTKYSIEHKDKAGDNTLQNDRIINAITQSLSTQGYSSVSKEESDFVFVFQVKSENKTDIKGNYQMIGFGGYGYYNGYGALVATPSIYKYTENTLIIDALNPKTNKIIWRGVAKDELSKSLKTPQEKTDYINRVVLKLLSSFVMKN